MKMKYKYIYFEEIEPKPKTKVWECRSSVFDDELIGLVKWYAQWRQYCFFSNGRVIMNKQCLDDVSMFVSEVMIEHRGITKVGRSRKFVKSKRGRASFD